MIMLNVGLIYVVASSCWLKGKTKTPAGEAETGETPQESMRRGGSAAARGKRSLARKSTAV
ncbi:hypothetical protein Q4S57_07450 [Priestia megaterium]|uniref:hypothetical protein n=1 Tax=Priestia megaterium TaxID=1404 RepID=UPI0026E34D74|nr:hypothetical protein [Priestia megaterium]MDO6847786.1 hypothetical protein [Priestia megaterium]